MAHLQPIRNERLDKELEISGMSRLTVVGLLALALCAVACTSKVTIGEI